MVLFPVVVAGASVVVAESAHVDLSEVDGSGVVCEPVDDRVGSRRHFLCCHLEDLILPVVQPPPGRRMQTESRGIEL